MKFSTVDNDNDRCSGSCAANYRNGWWHNSCNHIDPNYQRPYVYLNKNNYYLLFIEMKIRQQNCLSQ